MGRTDPCRNINRERAYLDMAGPETFTCQYCGEEFDSKRALSGHENLQCDAREDGPTADQEGTGDDEDNSDGDEWLEKAQQVREKLEEVKEEEIEDDDPATDTTDKDTGAGSGTSSSVSSGDGRRETDIGVVKLIQQGHGPPELFLEMGEVEIPLYANFQLKEDGHAAVLQALDVEEDDLDAFYGSSKTHHAGTRSVGFDESADTPEAVERSLTADFGVNPEVLEGLDEEDIDEIRDQLAERNEIRDRLASEYDIDRDRMSEKDLEQLHAMQEELREKEKIIDRIVEEHGMEPDDLPAGVHDRVDSGIDPGRAVDQHIIRGLCCLLEDLPEP
jgi:hypothetical protein